MKKVLLIVAALFALNSCITDDDYDTTETSEGGAQELDPATSTRADFVIE